jgi:hypothetical protein
VLEVFEAPKAQLKHGQWLPWLRDHCSMSERTAQLYMRMAKARPEVEANPQRVADLTLRGAMAVIALAEGEALANRVKAADAALMDEVRALMEPEACDADWTDMPAYDHVDLSPKHSIIVNFRNQDDVDRFAALIEQDISGTKKSIWYPKVEIARYADKRYVSDRPLLPKYPIYIVSKGRWEKPLTAMQLEAFGAPYRIVVEPQEYEHYSKAIDPGKILKLPFSNLGQGSTPARNWIWEHAIGTGARRHWILDDNLYMFLRFHENLKVPVADSTIFGIAENFVDRYDNVAISGFNYIHFIDRKKGNRYKPFRLNTRIYSCILIQNDIPYRWRGKYNEDTELSIRVLKDGWCTLLFNAFLADKTTTMRMSGGNTDELYAGKGGNLGRTAWLTEAMHDARKQMAQALKELHPDVVRVERRFGHWHHVVDYSPFKNNVLKPAKNPPEPLDDRDDYGFRLIELSR